MVRRFLFALFLVGLAVGDDDNSTTTAIPSTTVAETTLRLETSTPPNDSNKTKSPILRHYRDKDRRSAEGSSERRYSKATVSTTTPQPIGPTTPYEQRHRCQDSNTLEFISSAMACRNERPDRICALLFDKPDPKTGKRDPKCNVAGMEDIANSCRQQCGICCEDLAFACEDDDNQIIDCSKQTDKCEVTKWFDVLARFCAGSCGLCIKTDCRDFTIKCREQKHLCLAPSHIDEMRQKCARTCGFCVVKPSGSTENSITKRLPALACVDQAANCTGNEALCTNPQHADYMIKYCAKTCLKCNSVGQSQQTHVVVPVIGNNSPELNGTAAVLVPASVIMSASKNSSDKCEDHHPKCGIWVGKGFCKHVKYTDEQRRTLCPRSCKLC